MSEPALDEVIDQLALQIDELREQGRLKQRGGERFRARGAETKGKPTAAERTLTDAPYQRELGTRDLLDADDLVVHGVEHR
ncbi:hypothetical protein E4K10_05470 [Streptomyces sp. T1317-0309]|nr:hypothetical protein E4K10_05470 [Streptomyces sp. T1317-0309]